MGVSVDGDGNVWISGGEQEFGDVCQVRVIDGEAARRNFKT